MKGMEKGFVMLCCACLLAAGLSGCRGDKQPEEELAAKPVIYLYPEKKTEVEVKLAFAGELTATYPAYGEGWSVTALPDGTLTNNADGREYSYLFWEGVTDTEYDFSKGFVVAGTDVERFLQQTLDQIGLTPKESNEFIVYWLPRMQENAYNRISFQSDCYTESARLEITPAPDRILRVFMAYQAIESPVEMEPQEFQTFQRNGFCAVEWGGTEIR